MVEAKEKRGGGERWKRQSETTRQAGVEEGMRNNAAWKERGKRGKKEENKEREREMGREAYTVIQLQTQLGG